MLRQQHYTLTKSETAINHLFNLNHSSVRLWRMWAFKHTQLLANHSSGQDFSITISSNRALVPENFLFRGHRKCTDSRVSVWYGNDSNQDCKALQRVVRLAERISGSALPSLQVIYLKRCKSRAAKILKTQITPVTSLLFPAIWQALQEYDGKNWETEEELLPSGHQAPKLSLITSTRFNLINSKIFTVLHQGSRFFYSSHTQNIISSEM